MTERLACFKAYDIRGRVPEDLNADLARQIGRAYVAVQGAKKVIVGRDMRLSSEEICDALSEGLMEAGADVIDIGLCGTENVYFATSHLEKQGVDGGIMVTASHNPANYNGMKFVGKGAVPISGDTGLFDIEEMARLENAPETQDRGELSELNLWDAYTDHLLTYLKLPEPSETGNFKVVVNAGNGCAGLAIDELEKKIRGVEFVKVFHEPDGTFPHGVPNPLLEVNRAPTENKVRETKADLGIAWDGDFDRCFFFDNQGAFVEGYYMVGLFADELLQTNPGAKIVHDPRLTWNTVEMVQDAGGVPVQCKTGHAFIKERMRKEDAVYGGEMSAHHYFKDFAFCDTGMVPWLLLLSIMARRGKTLRELITERMERFPCSGEINREIQDKDGAIARVRERFEADAKSIDETDGLSLEFDEWRLNIRKSNTEPLLRLNVESRGNQGLMLSKTDEVLELLG